MVRGVASGRYRAYVGTAGVNLVDVRDVARGHLLAFDRGRSGERYLLGGENLSLKEVFARIARAAGRPPPRIRVPYAAVRAGAALGLVNRNEALLARPPEYFSSAKAQRELGYGPPPIDDALRRAVSLARVRRALPPRGELAEHDHADEHQPDDQHAA